MYNHGKKNLIVVVNEKTRVYGELLSAFIAETDDKYDDNGNLTNDGIIGVKDGTVDVVVWDEKTYIDNQPKLGLNNKIVFIGDLKVAKSIKPNINFNNELSTYGINFGSFGNKAMVYINSKEICKDRELYNEFILSYKDFISNIGLVYSNDQVIEKNLHIEDFNDKKRETSKNIVKFPIKLFNKIFPDKNNNKLEIKDNKDLISKIDNADNKVVDVSTHVVKLIIPVFWLDELVDTVEFGVVKFKTTKYIADQQYRYAIFAFYINKLAKFLG